LIPYNILEIAIKKDKNQEKEELVLESWYAHGCSEKKCAIYQECKTLAAITMTPESYSSNTIKGKAKKAIQFKTAYTIQLLSLHCALYKN
jgi:hypothetical protein